VVSLVQLVGLLAVWASSAAVVILVAATTDLGPVVLELSHNHGVHAGDVATAVLCAAAAVAVSAWILLPRATAGW
jgi:hypothetical protein